MHRLLLEGDLTPAEALGEGEIVLTTAMAEVLQIGVGDSVSVRTQLGEREMRVGGLVEELISSVIYADIDEVTRGMPLSGTVFNGLYLQVEPDRLDGIEEALYHLPGAAAVQQEQQIRESIEELMGLFYLFTSFMLFFALAMSFALIFNAMTVNVLERQRELATMRAIGTGSARVMRQLLAENVILWLLVLLPGMVLGYWMAQQIGDTFSAEFFSFEIVINPLSYAITAAGILLTMLLATWPAARRINHLNLAEATKVLT
jgi:putative ABC transport system permease protein